MRKAFQDHLFLQARQEIDDVIDFIDWFFNDRPRFEAACTVFEKEEDRFIVAGGWFKADQIPNVMNKARGLTQWSHHPAVTQIALQRLVDWALISDLRPLLPEAKGMPEFRMDREEKNLLWSRSFAEDIIRGPLFFIEKYRPSLPVIVVVTSDHEPGVATGFLIEVEKDSHQHPLVVTNKHVTGASTIKEVVSIEAGDHKYAWTEVVELTKFDLAAIKVTPPDGAKALHVSPSILLEDVIAVGFPKVAVSTEHTLLAHKGEINGTIRNRHDGNDYLAISCAVAPGNSGGPVLNEGGRVVGVVSASSSGRYGSGKGGSESVDGGVHHLAIPEKDLRLFINEEVYPKLSNARPSAASCTAPCNIRSSS